MTARELGPRRGDGQLQPGDGLDRLRHLRPPLLRAADRRGRARGLRAGAARGRDRPVRRPDAAEAGPRPGGGGRAAARHPGRRDRPGRGPRPLRRPAAPARDQAPALRDRALGRGGGGDRRARSASRCWSGPPTCSAAGRWRSATRPRTSTPTWRPTSRPTRSTRCCSTASSRTRSRSTSTRSPTASEVYVAGIMQHVEEAGVHSGDSACVIPPMSLGEEMLEEIRATTERIALELGVIGLINIQYGVAGGELLRDRGQPARLAHRALRLQGDRRAAGEDRLPADAGREARRPGPARAAGRRTSASRRRCCPSPASPAPTRCSARR